MTFYFSCVAWVFFRADSFADAFSVLEGFCLLSSSGTNVLGDKLLLWMVPLGLAHWLSFRGLLLGWLDRVPDWAVKTTTA